MKTKHLTIACIALLAWNASLTYFTIKQGEALSKVKATTTRHVDEASEINSKLQKRVIAVEAFLKYGVQTKAGIEFED